MICTSMRFLFLATRLEYGVDLFLPVVLMYVHLDLDVAIFSKFLDQGTRWDLGSRCNG